MKMFLAIIAALAMFAGAAQAEGFYVGAGLGVEASKLDSVEDSMQGKLAFGYDFEAVRLDVEYGWGNNTAFAVACPKLELGPADDTAEATKTCYGPGADDELAIMLWYDFDTGSKFTPSLGAGGGFMVEEWSGFDTGGEFWKAGGGVSYSLTPNVALTGVYTYRQGLNDSDDNRSEVVVGTRIYF